VQANLRIVAITTVVSGISSLSCALAGSLEILVVLRVAVGLTAAAIIPLSFAWLGDAVPYERRQAVLAYFLSGQISGLVLGQTFAGIIAEHYGWRYVFVAMAAVFILAGIALFNEMRIHGTGAKAVPEDEEGPLVRLFAMVRQTWVMIVLVGGMFEGMIFFGAYTFVGSYLWARFGLSLDLVGLIVAGFGVGGLIYSWTAARMLPRLGEAGLVTWGGVLVAISFVAITIAPSAGVVVPATILAGFSYYMIHNTLQTHATQMAPAMRGLAIATFASFLFLGQAAGVAIAAPIFDATGGPPIFLAAGALLFVFGIVYRTLLKQRP
jgi:MFS transporter, YNFM family, putative membrane transport protein